jgi:hypothetical protein
MLPSVCPSSGAAWKAGIAGSPQYGSVMLQRNNGIVRRNIAGEATVTSARKELII